MWHSVGGGESGWATPDPTDSNIVWSTASGSGMVGGIVERFEESRRHAATSRCGPTSRTARPPGVKLPLVLDAPLQISPHDHNTVYVGSQHVHRTTNGGQSWEVISPDLTLNDKSRMGTSGGLTPDNIGVEYAGVVYRDRRVAAREGPDLGRHQRRPGAAHPRQRQDVDERHEEPAGAPGVGLGAEHRPVPLRRRHRLPDGGPPPGQQPRPVRLPHHRLRATWKLIVNGIPKSLLSYAKVIREDPVRRGMLYRRDRERALRVLRRRRHAGSRCSRPAARAGPLADGPGALPRPGRGTYGRGFYILDDITPLRSSRRGAGAGRHTSSRRAPRTGSGRSPIR